MSKIPVMDTPKHPEPCILRDGSWQLMVEDAGDGDPDVAGDASVMMKVVRTMI